MPKYIYRACPQDKVRVEAPAVADIAIDGHSPFKLEQTDYRQNFPRIMVSTSEMAKDLIFSNPVEVFRDIKSVYLDFAKAAGEWARLQVDPVYYGIGVPKGHGETVIPQGGLLSMVAHYRDLFNFLGRTNYNVEFLRWGINVGPPKEVGRKLLQVAVTEAKKSGRRVKGIGHSLGVYEWLAAFAQDPYKFVASVDHLILDGGPWPQWVNKAVETVYLLTNFPFGNQNEDEVAEIAQKVPLMYQAEAAGDLKITSVLSSHDPVVRGIPLGRPQSQFVIKGASHAFLSGHPDSLRVTAYELAGVDPQEANRPSIQQLSLAA